MAGRSLIPCAACVVLLLGAVARSADAQSVDSAPVAEPAVDPASSEVVSPIPVRDVLHAAAPAGWASPALQTTLLASFAALEALDAATTLRGIRLGRASEANPLMAGLAQHPAALVGVKAGLTAATIFSMRSLSKAHPKAAVLTMLALNAGSAFVVRSNFQLVLNR
jgi:uncharacterized protein DUF5658